ncbi:unnamed protein product, partial [Prorocentrum cordatum]
SREEGKWTSEEGCARRATQAEKEPTESVSNAAGIASIARATDASCSSGANPKWQGTETQKKRCGTPHTAGGEESGEDADAEDKTHPMFKCLRTMCMGGHYHVQAGYGAPRVLAARTRL